MTSDLFSDVNLIYRCEFNLFVLTLIIHEALFSFTISDNVCHELSKEYKRFHF